MLNTFGKIVKVFAITGILLVAVLYLLLIVDVIKSAEFQEGVAKAIQIIGTITVASVLVVVVSSLGNKN